MGLESVTKTDIEAYETHVAGLYVTKGTVTTKLICLQTLWVLRAEIGSGLSFNPYVQTRSLSKKAKKIGSAGGHTPTILPNDFFSIINFSDRKSVALGKRVNNCGRRHI